MNDAMRWRLRCKARSRWRRCAALITAAAPVLALACGASPDARDAAAPDTIIVRVHEGTALYFDITPDGRSIVMDLFGRPWELPVAGGRASPLAVPAPWDSDDRQPAVSPDGRWIATRSDRPGGRGIWLIERGGGALRQLTDSAMILGGDDGVPAWSPDGSRIAFVRAGRIQLLDVRSGERMPLAAGELADAALDEPAWSPDGRRLVVTGPWSGSARALLDGPPGAGLHEIDIATGAVRRLTADGEAARAPEWSPDGRRIAFFAGDAQGRFRVVVQAAGGTARTVAADSGIEPRRVRWSPDGGSLFYVARGRIHTVAAAGGPSREIPFTAELRMPRPVRAPSSITLPEPGQSIPARGFSGLGIAPDGRSFAMLALARLWLVDARGRAREVAKVPLNAAEIAWSPDGTRIAWTDGDIHITELRTRTSRRVTHMTGEESQLAWAPDGARIAFVHWLDDSDEPPHIYVIAAAARDIETHQSTRDLGALDWSEIGAFASALQWLPTGDSLFIFGADGWPVANRHCAGAALVPLSGERRAIAAFPCRPGHVVLQADGSMLAIEDGVLTHHRRSADGWAEPDWRGDVAAFHPSAARDGTILYVAPDGIRLRPARGPERRIGWPVHLRVPAAAPLIVRNVRLVPLDGGTSDATRDILIAGGGIRRIAEGGTLDADVVRGATVLDADGAWALPGLIDTHTHFLRANIQGQEAALYHGTTTVREMWHPLAIAAAFRDGVAAGRAQAARIIVSGPPFYPSPSGRAFTTDFLQIPVDSVTAMRGLDMLAAFGAGHVKMRYTQSWSAAARFIRMAHAHGLPVGGHCAHALPAVAAGVDTHEHLDGQCGDLDFGIRDDIVQLYRAAGVTAVPVISLHLRNASARDSMRARRAGSAARSLHEGGVPVAVGVDASGDRTPFVHDELRALVDAGLPPAAALRAATRTAAAALGLGSQLGRLEPGYRADLLLLDADPLADIRNVTRIRAIIQDGRVIDRAALLSAAAAFTRDTAGR